MSWNVAPENRASRRPLQVSRDYLFSAGFAGCGTLLVGTTFALIWYAIPERGIAKQWYVYGPFLLGPYLLVAFGTWLTAEGAQRNWVRVIGIVVCLMGIAILLTAFDDLRPVFTGGNPPGIPVSAFISLAILIVQYMVGLVAGLIGIAGRDENNRQSLDN